MDIIKVTSELASVLKENDLGSLFVKNGELEISISAKTPDYHGGIVTPVPLAAAAQISELGDVAPSARESGIFVTSPMVGTFYCAPAPGKAPFVKVGDRVSKGQVVCIVEAMKLMNEVQCEFDGTVAEILVKDGDLVQFDEKMIRIN
ncbi:MAG: acetyl-CoA carboxylase biotin carboxyl carrier protein [Oscillospiraceae bacterium]|nr:acetyl-CoA carboxylase biotin carboxyl carrier protein [Oscillospiraceae bacterium]